VLIAEPAFRIRTKPPSGRGNVSATRVVSVWNPASTFRCTHHLHVTRCVYPPRNLNLNRWRNPKHLRFAHDDPAVLARCLFLAKSMATMRRFHRARTLSRYSSVSVDRPVTISGGMVLSALAHPITRSSVDREDPSGGYVRGDRTSENRLQDAARLDLGPVTACVAERKLQVYNIPR